MDPTRRPLTDAQRVLLAAQLPRDAVRKLPGKSSADYVSGFYVIQRLIEVFGPDGWADEYEAPVVREGDRPVIHVRGTLTAAGVTRGDVGVGVAANNSPDAFETAMKGAYTDCLKRCARKLGDSFGLALYEKVEGGRPRSGVGLSTTALAMLDEVAALPSVEAVNAWAKQNAPHVTRLDVDEQDIVKGAVAERRRELATDEPPPSDPTPRSTGTIPGSRHGTPSAPAAPTAPPVPAPLAAYRARIAAVTTPATLVAVALELAPSVRDHREAAWAALSARAASVAAPLTAEQLTAALGEARAASADPAHWRAAGKLFAALDDATDAAAVKAAIAAHGAALANLPEALRAVCRQAITARRAALAPAAAPTEVAAALEDALRRAEDIPALDAVAERVEAAVRQGTVTADQARALVALHDQLCTAMEREPCAASEAA